MLELDATRLLDYMLRLWPKWDRNEETDRLWYKYLTGPLDYERAREAADRYRMDTSFNSPKPKGLTDALRSMPCDRTAFGCDRTAKADAGYGEFFIECFDGRQRGRRVPIMFRRSREKPHPSAVQALAEDMRVAHEGTYGGRWRTVEDPGGEVYFAGAKYLRDGQQWKQQKGQSNER